MVIWLYGYMVIWLYGYMVIWLYGYMVIWLYGYMVIWLYGFQIRSATSGVTMKMTSCFLRDPHHIHAIRLSALRIWGSCGSSLVTNRISSPLRAKKQKNAYIPIVISFYDYIFLSHSRSSIPLSSTDSPRRAVFNNFLILVISFIPYSYEPCSSSYIILSSIPP